MLQRSRTMLNAITLAGALSLTTIAPALAQQAVQPPGPVGDAGFFTQIGGPVKRKLARTQTAATTFGETPGWFSLPLATLTQSVPAGTTDLFNVSFTAECRLFNGGADDWVRIRVIDTSTGLPLEPYDGQQAFCSANTYDTHTAMWSRRLGPGVHTLQVQFWIFDGAPAEVLTAWIDDWTFEVVVYD